MRDEEDSRGGERIGQRGGADEGAGAEARVPIADGRLLLHTQAECDGGGTVIPLAPGGEWRYYRYLPWPCLWWFMNS